MSWILSTYRGLTFPATFPPPITCRTPLSDERAMGRTLARMASDHVERSGGTEQLVLVGIQRRGVELADRLKRLINSTEGSHPPLRASWTSPSIETICRPWVPGQSWGKPGCLMVDGREHGRHRRRCPVYRPGAVPRAALDEFR